MENALSKSTLNKSGLDFHHIGLAVSNPKPAEQVMKALGYRLSRDTFDPKQNVNLIFCEHAGLPNLEIVYAKSKPNPIGVYLEQSDPCWYHICYSTSNLDKSLTALKNRQLRLICVSPPKPAILFGGRKVSFYFAKGFGLIEFLEQRRG